MTTRKDFIRSSAILTATFALQKQELFARGYFNFESKRPLPADRHFTSEAVENMILRIKKGLKNKELGWLFENCFPNTLDTTVDFEMINGRPDTYVITGDIDAMWLRDSSAQVWPYLALMKNDAKLQQLIAGVINRQTNCIHIDPYANAFYKDETKVSEWKSDLTEMKPGIHERKWEIDSLCYPIRLAHKYWKLTGDTKPFDSKWKAAIALTLKTFKEQQRKKDSGPYHFMRTTAWATDGVPMAGYGYPVKPVGLICSVFRPSDDSTIYPFLIPSNFFAVVSLRQAAEMLNRITGDAAMATECILLANEVEAALKKYATVNHPTAGKVYAYEINGFGSYNLMDDANVPSLLSLPYLGAIAKNDAVYQQTRKLLLSPENPFFFKGKAGEGIGGPHCGMDMIWPISITMRALTSNNDAEVKSCIQSLVATHDGTGFMHESFHKDDAAKFTRKWFAWANTLFGELIMETFERNPSLI
ncbi:glycoside hydrolase family 125 protein [Ferruginibacter sp. HRS2-29]|uniref:glycoside hydrolase family 125 protein n=1 Tax=Ferruginibacter sp. HRS2-29 TaxID=2487334 RepID=UPI0020CDD185|nr:glycoside hydrolase family 125 protein [Ferruginibacter sp. HRS2-29]MCP9751162.1 glycoside hydrolase family 125 protein [Ferruginibacter sp. HRS2-29]